MVLATLPAEAQQAVPALSAHVMDSTATLSAAQRQALEAKSIVIDLMLLYTKKVADSYIRDPGDLSALEDPNAVEEIKKAK